MTTTVGARLRELSGLTGVTMAAHLAAIVARFSLTVAAPMTVAAVLSAYSGLTGATVAQHLLAEHAQHVLGQITRPLRGSAERDSESEQSIRSRPDDASLRFDRISADRTVDEATEHRAARRMSATRQAITPPARRRVENTLRSR